MISQLKKLRNEIKLLKRLLVLKKIKLNKNTFDYLANEVQIKDCDIFIAKLDKIIRKEEN